MHQKDLKVTYLDMAWKSSSENGADEKKVGVLSCRCNAADGSRKTGHMTGPRAGLDAEGLSNVHLKNLIYTQDTQAT